jgi:DMSO/TMAO reductase YedYZ molybdopterin-dependent catalytic subunit
MHPASEPEWLHGHAHEPNLTTPAGDGGFLLLTAGVTRTVNPSDLSALPQTELSDCYIVSTGHGTSGPFRFAGVLVRDLLSALAPGVEAAAVDVVSADGFGTRLMAADWDGADERAPLLAIRLDGAPLSRAQGLVRLVVPSETDDALRQVKWVAEIRLHPAPPA